ncbi:NAD(P)H-dependent oxidoreductase [Flagellimonas marina]|uniref:NAD(P)H-dependent oxidoreductase n=1 Tax=Flagellimonas marina TaxID=1775168 RepID=A0ABV8PLP4_9FLAO
MKLLEHLQWRYATKKFDPSQKINQDDLEKLKKAVQLSVSSYGLQLYKVLVISDEKIREKLLPFSWGQSQVTEASHLFVFCNYTEHKEEDVDAYITSTSKIQGTPLEKLEGYGDFIKKSLSRMNPSQWLVWSEKQTYLALSNLLTACAELKIDACPMEGFDQQDYNRILDLEDRGLNVSIIASIGYRSKNDHSQFRQKVRKPIQEIFEEL